MTQNEQSSDNFETRAIHAGQGPDPENGAVMTPVYLTSTFKQDAPAVPRQGYEYSRTSNPTRTALEENVASLEGGAWGLCFASGLSATNALLAAGANPNAPDNLGATPLHIAARHCCAVRPGHHSLHRSIHRTLLIISRRPDRHQQHGRLEMHRDDF